MAKKKPIKLKKFQITELYSDLCFFKKVSIVEAKDEESAEEEYFQGNGEYQVLMDEIYEQKNDTQWSQIEEIEEIS